MNAGTPAEAPGPARALHLRCVDAIARGAVEELLGAVDSGCFVPPTAAEVAAVGPPAEALADSLCRVGLLLVQHDRGEQAIGAYRVALAYWPQHAGALLLMGRLHHAANDLAAAEDCARRLVALEPQDSEVRRELAHVLLESGKLSEADHEAQAAVKLMPFDAAGWYLLGQVRARRDRPAQAAAFMGEAVRLDPNLASAWRDLAGLLHPLGRLAEAETAAARFAALATEDPAALRLHAHTLLDMHRVVDAETALRKAVALAPDFAEAWSELSRVQERLGNLVDAEASARRFVALSPQNPDAHNQLGLALLDIYQFAAAEAEFQTAVACRPDYADSYVYLGEVRTRGRKFDLAEKDFRRALELDPESLLVHGRFAGLLTMRGRPAEAAALLESFLARYPDAERIALRLGGVWCELGRLAEAEGLAKRALERTPRSAAAHALLGRVRECAGDSEAAVDAYVAAVTLDMRWSAAWLGLIRMRQQGSAMASAYLLRSKPALLERFYHLLLLEIQSGNESGNYSAVAHDAAALLPGNKLMRTACTYVRAYDGEESDADIGRAYRAIWGPIGDRAAASPVARPSTSRLRVGYIGQYLHSTLMNQYFRHHDFDAFEIFLYSDDDRSRIDPLPPQVRWCPVKGTDLAQSYRANGIDLCVDVLGPLPFAPNMELAEQIRCRIAPVQCTWIDTFTSFGGSAHDFIISDAEVVPPEHEGDFVERIIRLPETHWSFAPPSLDVEPGELPALRNGYVTFGVANRTIKMTDETLAMWAASLHAVPESRLRFFGAMSLNFMLRQQLRSGFARRGIDPDRIEFAGPGSQRQVLEFYQTVDIALDTYARTGGITGFEGLWMGVPLVTRTGQLLVSRWGRSMLACIDRRQWIAESAAGFVDIVRSLAGDIPALARERARLRPALLSSPLCQGERFARNLETAFRAMILGSA